jgi:hypothetical protein
MENKEICPHGREIDQICPHCLGINNNESKDVKIEAENIEIKEELPKDSPLRRLVKPHKLESRLVTEADIDRLIEEARILHQICFGNYGIYHGAYAMHHSQIDDKDPLNFFVTKDFKIIINPEITRHSNYTVDSKEGCVTFPELSQVVVQRWQKIEVSYVTIMVNPEDKDKFKLSSKIEESLSGMNAKVFQHEFFHGQGQYIHDIKEEIIN